MSTLTTGSASYFLSTAGRWDGNAILKVAYPNNSFMNEIGNQQVVTQISIQKGNILLGFRHFKVQDLLKEEGKFENLCAPPEHT